MTYVLDSNVLIEVFAQRKLAQKIAGVVKDEPMVTTSICMHEVLTGARSDKERFIFEGLFAGIQVLEHTVEAARIGSYMANELLRNGMTINTPDLLIAGICKANNAELVTLDGDFTRINNLKVHFLK